MMLLIFSIIFVIGFILIAVWIYKYEMPNNFRSVYNQSELEKIHSDNEPVKTNLTPESAHPTFNELMALPLEKQPNTIYGIMGKSSNYPPIRTKICKRCNLRYWATTETECSKCGNQLEIKKQIPYQEIWDKGEDSYSEPEYKLFKLKGGERLDGILDGCTVCPTDNSSCLESFDIVLQGFHPDRVLTPKAILICSMGIDKKDSMYCVMNK